MAGEDGRVNATAVGRRQPASLRYGGRTPPPALRWAEYHRTPRTPRLPDPADRVCAERAIAGGRRSAGARNAFGRHAEAHLAERDELQHRRQDLEEKAVQTGVPKGSEHAFAHRMRGAGRSSRRCTGRCNPPTSSQARALEWRQQIRWPSVCSAFVHRFQVPSLDRDAQGVVSMRPTSPTSTAR